MTDPSATVPPDTACQRPNPSQENTMTEPARTTSLVEAAHAELVQAITAADTNITWTTERIHVNVDPPLRLPGYLADKLLLSVAVETTRYPGDIPDDVHVFGTVVTVKRDGTPHDGLGSHRVTLPQELAARYLPATAHAA